MTTKTIEDIAFEVACRKYETDDIDMIEGRCDHMEGMGYWLEAAVWVTEEEVAEEAAKQGVKV